MTAGPNRGVRHGRCGSTGGSGWPDAHPRKISPSPGTARAKAAMGRTKQKDICDVMLTTKQERAGLNLPYVFRKEERKVKWHETNLVSLCLLRVQRSGPETTCHVSRSLPKTRKIRQQIISQALSS